MRTYQNKKDGFKQIKRKALIRTLPLMVLALAVGIGFSYSKPDDGQIDTLPFVILLGLGVLAFGLFKGFNRQRQLFESYLLTIDDEFIIREQLNTPTVKIRKNEIREIRAASGGLAIRGQNRTDFIIVTDQIDDYSDLVHTLKEIKEFSTSTGKSLIEKLSLPLAISTLGLMAAVVISSNKYLVLVSGTVVTSILVWSFYEIQTSKNIDSKTKKNSWWTVVVLFAVIVITYTKVVG